MTPPNLVRIRLEVDRVLPIKNLTSLVDQLTEWGLTTAAQEELWVVTLDGINNVRTVTKVAIGTYHDLYVSLPTILSPVLLAAADRFVLAHNHPNGNVAPTDEDRSMTARVESAAQTLDLEFDDHVIVGPPRNWLSMRNRGYI